MDTAVEPVSVQDGMMRAHLTSLYIIDLEDAVIGVYAGKSSEKANKPYEKENTPQAEKQLLFCLKNAGNPDIGFLKKQQKFIIVYQNISKQCRHKRGKCSDGQPGKWAGPLYGVI